MRLLAETSESSVIHLHHHPHPIPYDYHHFLPFGPKPTPNWIHRTTTPINFSLSTLPPAESNTPTITQPPPPSPPVPCNSDTTDVPSTWAPLSLSDPSTLYSTRHPS